MAAWQRVNFGHFRGLRQFPANRVLPTATTDNQNALRHIFGTLKQQELNQSRFQSNNITLLILAHVLSSLGDQESRNEHTRLYVSALQATFGSQTARFDASFSTKVWNRSWKY